MRVLECCRVRVKDVDFGFQIMVRAGKGEKDRVVPLPRRAEPRTGQAPRWEKYGEGRVVVWG